jgi:hypothetical protein
MADEPTSESNPSSGGDQSDAPGDDRPAAPGSTGAPRWYGPDGQPYGGQPYGGQAYGEQPSGTAPQGHGPSSYWPSYPQQRSGYESPGGYYEPRGYYDPFAPSHHHRYAWPFVPPRPPRSAEERKRRRRRGIAFAGVLVLAVGAGIGIGAAIAPTSPATVAKGVVSSSIAAATATGSYRYVELTTVSGAHDDIKGDAAPEGGSQVILQSCKAGTNLFDLRLVRGTVYFRGNTPAVVDQLGISATKAPSLNGKWVKVTKSDGPYHTFAGGITARSNVSQLRTVIVPFSTRHVSGSPNATTEVLGRLSAGPHRPSVGSATLVVDASSRLPVSVKGSASGTSSRYTVSWTFAKFGKKVVVSAPGDAVGYATLHAKGPQKKTCA